MLKYCLKCRLWHDRKPFDEIHYPYIFCYMSIGKKLSQEKKRSLKELIELKKNEIKFNNSFKKS